LPPRGTNGFQSRWISATIRAAPRRRRAIATSWVRNVGGGRQGDGRVRVGTDGGDVGGPARGRRRARRPTSPARPHPSRGASSWPTSRGARTPASSRGLTTPRPRASPTSWLGIR